MRAVNQHTEVILQELDNDCDEIPELPEDGVI
jgi:hypothetical protein